MAETELSRELTTGRVTNGGDPSAIHDEYRP
jgi:hypothetical protein